MWKPPKSSLPRRGCLTKRTSRACCIRLSNGGGRPAELPRSGAGYLTPAIPHEQPQPEGCATGLHLVASEVLVVEVLEPFAQLVAAGFFRDIGGVFRALQHPLFDVDRTVMPQRQRQRVTRA